MEKCLLYIVKLIKQFKKQSIDTLSYLKACILVINIHILQDVFSYFLYFLIICFSHFSKMNTHVLCVRKKEELINQFIKGQETIIT